MWFCFAELPYMERSVKSFEINIYVLYFLILKQWYILSPLFSNFALKHTMTKVTGIGIERATQFYYVYYDYTLTY
jgi:hypothetical protein